MDFFLGSFYYVLYANAVKGVVLILSLEFTKAVNAIKILNY